MILTQCAVCATELGLSLGKKCGRCSTRYCGAECQKQHWKGGGHDKLCKPIKRAGGAEQYNANTKYAEAVAVAAEACAEDTKGQTCYICTQALHWKTKEGLVRGCSCRGTAGFAHVSCLAEQAKILVAEGEENNLDDKPFNERWARWHTCSLCEQRVPRRRELRARVGVLEDVRGAAGDGLASEKCNESAWERFIRCNHYEDALPVQEAELSMLRRLGASANNMLAVQGNLAGTYECLDGIKTPCGLSETSYSGCVKLLGEEHAQNSLSSQQLRVVPFSLKRFEEAKVTAAQINTRGAARSWGVSSNHAHDEDELRASASGGVDGATLDDLREAVTMFEETERIAGACSAVRTRS